MINIKVNKLFISCILLGLICLYVCCCDLFIPETFAEEASPEFYSEQSDNDLNNCYALIATEKEYETDKSKLDSYVAAGGNLLVLSSQPNIIGTRYFYQNSEIKGTVLATVSEGNNILEKDNLDYKNILKDSLGFAAQKSSQNGENGSMFLSTTFYIFANNRNYYIAIAGLYTSVDYYKTNNETVNYYNVYGEVFIQPINSNYRVNSFSVDFHALTSGSLEVKSRTNNGSVPMYTTTISHSMGTTANSELVAGISSTISYSSSFSYPIDSVYISGGYPINYDEDGDGECDQIQSFYDVTPNGGAKYGKTYSSLFVHTYRTYNSVPGGFMIRIHNISITGYLANPNFEESNTDTVAIFGAWNNPFNKKSFMLAYGNTSDGNTGDYFDDFCNTGSFPHNGNLGGILIFNEEES